MTGCVVVALASLTACSGGSSSGPSAWTLTGSPWDKVDDDIEAWNESNPDQEISIESFANDIYKERIRTAVGSGESPTLIVSWGGGPLIDYSEQDYIVDITDETTDLRDRLLDSVVANGEVDGSVYAVPATNTQPNMLFYNQAVFDEHGVDVPQDWDDLLDAVDAFNEADVYPIALAGASRWPQLMWPSYLTDRLGGPEPYEAVMAGEPDAWSDPAILEALEMTQDLVERDGFDPNFSSVVADQNEDLQLVADGSAAMVLQTGGQYTQMANVDEEFQQSDDFGFTRFPDVPGGDGDPASVVGNPSNYWSISADAPEEDQQSAIDFLTEWIYNDDMVDSLLADGVLPPLEGLDDKIEETEESEYLSYAYDLAREAPSFQLSWDQAVDPAHVEPLLDNLEQIYMLDITPEEFAENMNELLD